MARWINISIVVLFFVLLTSFFGIHQQPKPRVESTSILSYRVDPQKQKLQFFWRDQDGQNYSNFQRLKLALKKENKTLVFAMNGGMFNKGLTPQGLYIENGIVKNKMDTVESGYGNFYLQPNGIFYLTSDYKAFICPSKKFEHQSEISYATQSGPMLLINGKIHPKFNLGSMNKHIRNGVGILPNGNILFAMSKEKIHFYDFATFFKKNGCKNALYLDGAISKTYLPSKNWIKEDGTFVVMIGEIL